MLCPVSSVYCLRYCLPVFLPVCVSVCDDSFQAEIKRLGPEVAPAAARTVAANFMAHRHKNKKLSPRHAMTHYGLTGAPSL